MSNIVETIAADKSLVSLAKGIKAGGFEKVLSGDGPYTVFAPTEIAFGKLQTGKWPQMLQPDHQEELKGFMNHYIVKGKLRFTDLTDGQRLQALDGKELSVKVSDGQVDIDGSRIQARDMEASNGVVHSLEKIVPFN